MAQDLAAALQAFLASGQRAGAKAPALQTVGAGLPISSFLAPALPVGGDGTPIDYSGITGFYSDPANSDYQQDPVLLQTEAQDRAASENADSAALKGRRALLAQLGDPHLAATVLGADDPTLGAVSDNPDTSTSILARLSRSYRDTVNNNEDQRNKSNLWYSSARAQGLQNDAHDYETQQADAVGNAQSALDQLSSELARAKGNAAAGDESAMADAYARYLAAASAHPPTAAPPNPAVGGDGFAPQPGLPAAQASAYPNVNASAPEQVSTPVYVGSQPASFEPKPTAGNYGVGASPLSSFLAPTNSANYSAVAPLTPAEIAARNKKQLA